MVADQKLTNEQYEILMKNSKIVDNHGPTIGKRHIQTLLVFLVIFMNYVMRVSMSIIIVAMTDPNASINKDIPTYNWTDKSLIMTSFMWGYMVPQIAAGYLATVFGAKWFLTGTLFCSSLSGFFIPLVAANLGSKGVIAMRIIQGLTQSFMFPSVHAFLGKWVPLQERSRLGTLPYMGSAIGVITSMLLTGVIASSWYGWPMALYLYGGVGLVVAVLFSYFCASEPDLHSTITKEEKYYIQNNLCENGSGNTKDIPVPWFEIFTSLPFWALIVSQIGFSWGNWTLLFETPIYMNHVMKFDLKSNSVLCSLPYIAEASCTMFYGFLADYLIVKKILTIGRTRKIMNTCGLLLPAIFMFLLAQCNSDDAHKAIIYLVLIGVASGAVKSGYNVNQIDLSPNFAGVLMGICNGLSAAVSSLGPMVVYVVVKNEEDTSQWKLVFYIAAAVSIVCLVFGIIFGSGSVQLWNEGNKRFRENYQQVPLKA